jgi:hypothetical protein
MKKKWHLSVKGKRHQLVVDGAASGEDVIHVDGRVAARPLDPDETQRAFFIDGVAYSLRRRGSNDFDLVPIGSGPSHLATAITVVDSGENIFVRLWRVIAGLLKS